MRFLHTLLCLFIVVASACAPLRAQSNSAARSREEQLSQRGQQALASGRFDQAESAFAELATLEPTVPEVYANLGAVYFQEGKFDAATDALRHALRLKPSLTRAKTLLAICLEESGHSAEAVPGLEDGFRSSAEPQVQRQCGLELLRAYTALHRDADAVETSLALNKAWPDDPEILYQTGRIYGNFAYLTMERLRDKAPNSVWMLQAKGEAQESEKQCDLALNSFESVLRVEPRRPGIHYRMGRVYLARFEQLHDPKDRDQAADQFRAELALDPLNSNAAYELAQIQYDVGNLDQARRQFESIIERRPEFEQARVGLAGILLETQKPGEAMAQLKRAIELDPSDEVAWYRLARALHLTGDPEGAKKALAEFQRLHALEDSRLARAGVLMEAGDITRQQLGETTPP
ncbi:MAG: tetratricopeptide repeat protein [Acidobacteriaceae bacterium]